MLPAFSLPRGFWSKTSDYIGLDFPTDLQEVKFFSYPTWTPGHELAFLEKRAK